MGRSAAYIHTPRHSPPASRDPSSPTGPPPLVFSSLSVIIRFPLLMLATFRLSSTFAHTGRAETYLAFTVLIGGVFEEPLVLVTGFCIDACDGCVAWGPEVAEPGRCWLGAAPG
jgi:hypothetical protein